MNDMTLPDPLLYSEDDYTTFARQHDDTTPAQRIAFFGVLPAAQMESRYESEVCSDCHQWSEPDEIDKFDGRCMECHHALPPEECPDPRRGCAAYINRKFA